VTLLSLTRELDSDGNSEGIFPSPGTAHFLALIHLTLCVHSAQVHGRSFGAEYPLLYVAVLITGVLAVVRRLLLAVAFLCKSV
jgi:hypothetical protein